MIPPQPRVGVTNPADGIKIANFMNCFIGATFEGNSSLKRGLIAGKLLPKGWHEIPDNSCIKDSYYADQFGFTEAETEELLTGFPEVANTVAARYNGYRINDCNLANPANLMQYLCDFRLGRPVDLIPVPNENLRRHLRAASAEFKTRLQVLKSEGIIDAYIPKSIEFKPGKMSSRCVLTFLLSEGYLTVLEITRDLGGALDCRLGFPNQTACEGLDKLLLDKPLKPALVVANAGVRADRARLRVRFDNLPEREPQAAGAMGGAGARAGSGVGADIGARAAIVSSVFSVVRMCHTVSSNRKGSGVIGCVATLHLPPRADRH